MLAVTSWLRPHHRTRTRFIFLIICSPLLIPLLCAFFPLICAVEICLRISRRRSRLKSAAAAARDSQETERIRRCEEGWCFCGGDRASEIEDDGEDEESESSLLQRYLEDQLLLVRSVYDCGGDDDEFDCRFPLLS